MAQLEHTFNVYASFKQTNHTRLKCFVPQFLQSPALPNITASLRISAILRETSEGNSYQFVRLVLHPYTSDEDRFARQNRFRQILNIYKI
ncbi:unnamed protein product [Onchocerca flexuosa]|uniref:Uncharacterized protein n=2 Tax=Onchocerca TaxID=6281 RepID=A0A183HEC8_9BILA|nr:unnamed protein product [Onchocerca flexuosa]